MNYRVYSLLLLTIAFLSGAQVLRAQGISAITGTSSVCAGSTATLSDSTSGGSWSSTNTAIAAVGSSTGIVTGVSAGTATVSYTVSGSSVTIMVVVNPLPAAITGASSVCSGSTVTLSDGTPGGAWSSGNTAVATVGSGAGTVTGVAAGTVNVSYILPSGCGAGTPITVNPSSLTFEIITTVAGNGVGGFSGNGVPATTAEFARPFDVAIDGSGNVYIADNGNNRIRKVNAYGIVTTFAGNGTAGFNGDGGAATAAKLSAPSGIAIDGIGNIYIADNGNNRIREVNTSGIISTIAGDGTGGFSGDGGPATAGKLWEPEAIAVDGGGSIYISDYSNNRIRKVNTSGIISTIAGNGTAGFSGDGSPATAAELNGPQGIAVDGGGNVYIADYLNERIRKISASGVINTVASNHTGVYSIGPTGVAVDGSGNVYFVDPAAQAIREINTSGTVSTFAGGTWTDGFNGDGVTALAAKLNFPAGLGIDGSGNLYIADVHNNRIRKIITSTAIPLILLPAYTCTGIPANLFEAPGGSWSSSNTSVAVIDSTGVVSGMSPGTTTISYAITNACYSYATSATLANHYQPDTIVGPDSVCTGVPRTFTDGSTGGIWSMYYPTYATVDTSGVVTPLVFHYDCISYTIGGCSSLKNFNVFTTPVAITGASSLCAGARTTYSDASFGGHWSSSNPTVATIGSASPVVMGVSAGTATITYNSSGCSATKIVTIKSSPATVLGVDSLCTGASGTFTTSTSGGVWSSSNSGARVGSASGIVTGLISSTDPYIVYTLPDGCSRSKIVAIKATPSAISGAANLCTGVSYRFTDAASGGAWSSSNASVAAVGTASHNITVVAAGTAVISYALSSGCSAAMAVTVNVSPTAITVPAGCNLCTGPTYTFTDGTSGGVWTSSNPACATVGRTSGIVTGLLGGSPNISYTLSSGCNTFRSVTVNVSPGAVSGAGSLCAGASSTLTDGSAGGAWSSNNTSVAVVGTSGMVSGVAAGTAVISYTLHSGCGSIKTVTVNRSPAVIDGPASGEICAEATYTFANSTAGGLWHSSAATIATVGSASGIVTGVAAGTAHIIYAISTGCSSSLPVAVIVPPSAISGLSSVSSGSSITLTDASVGGRWSSGNTAIATVGSANGHVLGVTAGTVTISYTLSSGCYSIKTVTVTHSGGRNDNDSDLMDMIPSARVPDVKIFPNPNKGMFTVVGSLGSAIDAGTNEEVHLEITDLMGQVVYSNTAAAPYGKLNEPVHLSNSLANGTYILNIHCGQGNFAFHFVIQQ